MGTCIAAGLVHVAAIVVSAVWLLPAHPYGAAVASRLKSIHEGWLGYGTAWASWFFATVATVLLVIVLSESLTSRLRGLRRAAIACAMLAAIPESFSNLVAPYMLTDLAHRAAAATDLARPAIVEIFLTVERLQLGASAIFANGVFSAAGLLLNVVAFRSAGFPRWLAVAGVPIWALGLFSSAAAVFDAGETWLAFWSVQMPAFVLWTWFVGVFYFGRVGSVPVPAEEAGF